MLEEQDIKKLTALLATKSDIIEIRQDIAIIQETLQGVLISEDALAASMSEFRLEFSAVKDENSRQNSWIQQIADKVGLKLKTGY